MANKMPSVLYVEKHKEGKDDWWYNASDSINDIDDAVVEVGVYELKEVKKLTIKRTLE